jgi:cation/acetate symporter
MGGIEMGVQGWTFLIVTFTFVLYIGVAIWSRARSTGEFYVAGKHVSPIANGMATAADWMSAASFISMAGLISFLGMDGSVYLMGWTGGYVLLALLIAPYLRESVFVSCINFSACLDKYRDGFWSCLCIFTCS